VFFSNDGKSELATLHADTCGIIAVVFAGWGRLSYRVAVAVPLLVAAGGCALLGPRAAAPAPPALAAPTMSAPVWQVGDRWVFEWTAGNSTGIKTVTVFDKHQLGGVPYYVLGIGDVEHYYTEAIHWAFAVRAAKVEARMVPPQPWFVWPLAVGGRWQHRGSFEDPRGRTPTLDTFSVLGVESVEVPAGRFQALRIVREGQDRETDEYWYAPEMRWYVRWVGRRPDVSFEERLKSYDPAPRPS
jgi:hypothetical protein